MAAQQASNPVKPPSQNQINQATKAISSLEQQNQDFAERARLCRKLNEKRKKFVSKVTHI